MNNEEIQAEVQRLRAARTDAHKRGFATLTCQVGDKPPYAKYSPHAANSATLNFSVAMAPYEDGIPANYGVNPAMSCGGLSVVDIDTGIDSIAALEAWMKKNNLPETFTVITGRDPFGAHLYYIGEQKTHPYKLDGVVGEVRSRGAFVVGFGSRHPSGRLYTIYKDIPMVALPTVFKESVRVKPATIKDDEFPLVDEGNRNARLTSLAGTLRNAGLTENGILAGLEDFARNRCIDGDAYADQNEYKLRDLARRAAGWDIAVKGELVFSPFRAGRSMFA